MPTSARPIIFPLPSCNAVPCCACCAQCCISWLAGSAGSGAALAVAAAGARVSIGFACGLRVVCGGSERAERAGSCFATWQQVGSAAVAFFCRCACGARQVCRESLVWPPTAVPPSCAGSSECALVSNLTAGAVYLSPPSPGYPPILAGIWHHSLPQPQFGTPTPTPATNTPNGGRLNRQDRPKTPP